MTIDAEIGDNASGVIYALGGAGGGLVLFMDKGQLVYEYNMMIIERYIVRSAARLPAGKRRIEVTTTMESDKPLSPADVVLKVDGQEVARTRVMRTVPAAFSASETFDVGVDLGSTVSLDYFDRRPFRFDGQISSVKVDLRLFAMTADAAADQTARPIPDRDWPVADGPFVGSSIDDDFDDQGALSTQ